VTLTPVPKLAGGSSGSTFSTSAGSSISPQGYRHRVRGTAQRRTEAAPL